MALLGSKLCPIAVSAPHALYLKGPCLKLPQLCTPRDPRTVDYYGAMGAPPSKHSSNMLRITAARESRLPHGK